MEDFRTVVIKSVVHDKLKEERAIVHLISTPDTDRTRDIMKPDGMNDKEFAKTPSVWYRHNYQYDLNAKPIGKSLWRKKSEDGVRTKTQFAKTDFADDIYLLHMEDFIKTWSIAFNPVYDKKGDILEGSIEYNESKNITTWYNWNLLEYSSTPLPVNIYAQDEVKELIKINFKSDFVQHEVHKIDFTTHVEQLKEELSQFIEDKFKKMNNNIEIDKIINKFSFKPKKLSKEEIKKIVGDVIIRH